MYAPYFFVIYKMSVKVDFLNYICVYEYDRTVSQLYSCNQIMKLGLQQILTEFWYFQSHNG